MHRRRPVQSACLHHHAVRETETFLPHGQFPRSVRRLARSVARIRPTETLNRRYSVRKWQFVSVAVKAISGHFLSFGLETGSQTDETGSSGTGLHADSPFHRG